MKEQSLLDQIGNFENLILAFKECSKGKKSTSGHQKFLFNYGEKIKSMEQEIISTSDYRWGTYREFYVYDPKKRLVMAAAYKDRVLHTAIHRVLDPILDVRLGARTFACRNNMGNRAAALRLSEQLKRMGKNRYCIKLDVQKYFQSIHHDTLYEMLFKVLPDQSLKKIIFSLLKSHKDYAQLGRGIPIGNLTSQAFANFYLSIADQVGCQELEIDFHEDFKEEHDFYIRYMDDIVILSRTKEKAIRVANQVRSACMDYLKLNIPTNKYVVLGDAPIPFLGYVMDECGYRVIRRNERKFAKKIKRLDKNNYSLSYQAQVRQSYEAWRELY